MAVTDRQQQQIFAIPVQITDEIANLSTSKRVCLSNSERYGINTLFKERAIKQEISYIFCTLFADQTEGAISASYPRYTTIESKITHKSDLNVHATKDLFT